MLSLEGLPKKENPLLEKLRQSPLAKVFKLSVLAASLSLLPEMETRAASDHHNATEQLESRDKLSPAQVVAHFQKQASFLENEIKLARKHDKIAGPEDLRKLPQDVQDFYRQMEARQQRYQEIIADPEAYLDWLESRTEEKRAAVLSHLQSPAFLEKLQIEWDCDLPEARERQQYLLENLASVDIKYLTPEQFVSQYGAKTEGVYTYKTHTIKLPLDKYFDDASGQTAPLGSTIEHEMFHAAYRGDDEISPAFSEKSEQSFRYYKDFGDDYKDYLGQPAERLVRKKILDLEMERLQIKKYGERFTPEHYQQLMKLYQAGELDGDIETLMQSTKPEDLESLVNDFAQTGSAAEQAANLS